MADRILKDFDKYKNLASDRFKSWLGEDALYECVNMEFGQIYYSDTRLWEKCFSLTFVRKGIINSEWNYTAKFKLKNKLKYILKHYMMNSGIDVLY